MSQRRIAAAVAAILLLAGGAYGYFWNYVAAELDAGMTGWAEQQRSFGDRADFDRDPISGFPFAFRTVFRNASLDWRLAAGTGRLEAAEVAAEMRPWNLQRIDFSSRGALHLELAPADAIPTEIAIGAARGTVRLFSGGTLRYLGVSLSATRLTTAQGDATVNLAELALELPAGQPADYRQPLFGLEAALHGVTLPPGRRALTAAPVELFSVTAAVMGPVPFAATLPSALRGWSSAGGTVELRRFAFTQAPLAVEGSGTLALDTELQPLGALAIRARGLAEAIALVERDGLLDAGPAATTKMLAKGMAQPDADGVPVVAVSLSLQQGYLWLGPARLAVLPRLGW